MLYYGIELRENDVKLEPYFGAYITKQCDFSAKTMICRREVVQNKAKIEPYFDAYVTKVVKTLQRYFSILIMMCCSVFVVFKLARLPQLKIRDTSSCIIVNPAMFY